VTTALNVVINQLVTTFTAGLPGVEVYDGPKVTSDAVLEVLFVGYDATEVDELTDMAETDQEWAQLGALRKYELGNVTCAVVVRGGDADLTARRNRAFQIVSDAEDALRGDPSFNSAVIFGGFLNCRLAQSSNSSGSRARVIFTVNFKARI
jgi:hypothetical protein